MIAFTGRLPRRAVSGIMVATCVVALCATAHAEDAPPYAVLLRQAADAPRSAESAAEVRRAEGLERQARARPNPTVGVMTENVAGGSPFSGFDRAETTMQWSQPIELGGKRSARIAAGEAGTAAARARDRDARIRYAYDLARAYAAAEIADRRVILAEDEVEEGENDLRAARALVDAGKESRLRALQAESSLNAVRADLEAAKAGRIAALARLSALAGVEELFTGISAPILDGGADKAPVTGPVDPTATSSYIAARAERDAAAYRLAAERRRTAPDVTVNVGVRRLEYERATALVGGVTIPLRIFDRNRGNIQASTADVEAADARVARARFEAQAEARATLAQIDAAEARVAAAERGLGTADETYRLARIAYESGKSSLLELLTARHGLGLARGVLLDANAARFEARAELARLQGRAVTGDMIP